MVSWCAAVHIPHVPSVRLQIKCAFLVRGLKSGLLPSQTERTLHLYSVNLREICLSILGA